MKYAPRILVILLLLVLAGFAIHTHEMVGPAIMAVIVLAIGTALGMFGKGFK